MQRLLLEVVVRAILLEDFKRGVGDEREGERRAGLVLLYRLTQAIDIVGADSDEIDASLLEAVGLGSKGAELLDAVCATFAEVKNNNNRPAGIICESVLIALSIGQRPVGCGRGAPAERAKRVE